MWTGEVVTWIVMLMFSWSVTQVKLIKIRQDKGTASHRFKRETEILQREFKLKREGNRIIYPLKE